MMSEFILNSSEKQICFVPMWEMLYKLDLNPHKLRRGMLRFHVLPGEYPWVRVEFQP